MGQILSPEQLARLKASMPLDEDLAEVTDSRMLQMLASLGRERLAGLMVERHYAPGEVVFSAGGAGDAMYVIWAGHVAVVRGEWSDPVILGYRGPGEVVGEMALLEDAPRSAAVVALEPLRLLCIDRADLGQLLKQDMALTARMLASLSARLRAADNDRVATSQAGQVLARQVADLESEKELLLEAQQVRQETSDLIVHDLRNPLGIVGSVLQMLEMVLPSDILQANRELLQIGHAASERMCRLVDSLLDVSRLETGEVPLHLAEVDLGRLAQDAFDRERLIWQEGRVRGQCRVPPGLGTVVCDEERIDRVLANLIENAVKYTPAGGQMTVAIEEQDDQVVVSVTDSGPGIPPTEREHIFERFARLGRERGRRRGFGLGLAFCRMAVEAHGGRIWVEPGPGNVGSRFLFTLPRRPAPAADTGSRTGRNTAPALPAAPGASPARRSAHPG